MAGEAAETPVDQAMVLANPHLDRDVVMLFEGRPAAWTFRAKPCHRLASHRRGTAEWM